MLIPNTPSTTKGVKRKVDPKQTEKKKKREKEREGKKSKREKEKEERKAFIPFPLIIALL